MSRSRDQIMTEWDAVRAKIADGCTNSGPRDWFEGVMDEQDHIIADLVRGSAKLETALRAMFDSYEGVFDMALPHQHQSDAAKRAEMLARDALSKQ